MALYQFEERKPRVAQGAFVAESALVIVNVICLWYQIEGKNNYETEVSI
jgi:hypothetical protein